MEVTNYLLTGMILQVGSQDLLVSVVAKGQPTKAPNFGSEKRIREMGPRQISGKSRLVKYYEPFGQMVS